MSLGERIYKLRTENNLSQGELADALGVSRQSVSKWETDGSVPELDKLVKLSQIFGVSLDELILDKKPQQPGPEQKVVYVERVGASGKKTAGIALLCFGGLLLIMLALFGDILAGFVLAAPFAACGLICLLAKKHTGLWCVWAVYLFIEIYLRFTTGVNWLFVFQPRLYSGRMPAQMIVAWALLAAFAALTVVTAMKTRKTWRCSARGDGIGAAASWGVYLLTWLIFASPGYQSAAEYASRGWEYRYIASVTGWVRSVILTVAVIFTLRLAASLREKQKQKRCSG